MRKKTPFSYSKRVSRILSFILTAILFYACKEEEGYPPLVPGELLVGVSQGTLDLPIGIPLGGYTGRDRLFSGLSENVDPPDERDCPYTTDFIPSAGIQTRITIKVAWFSNSTERFVLIKMDLIYAYDGMVSVLEEELSAATGEDLTDRIALATNHSHSAYGTFSNALPLYLGSDRYKEEIFQRMVEQVKEVALDAYSDLSPAVTGVGFDDEFDPIGSDEIYRDRREENDEISGLDGEPLGSGFKDPLLTLIRIDDASTKITKALIFNFGIHGTVMGADNPIISVDAPGHIELKIERFFDYPVTAIHLQGAVGDASPAGKWSDFAKMESIGELASSRIYSLYEKTKTSTKDVIIEAATRSIVQDRGVMHVEKGGTTDLYYSPFIDEYVPDGVIYDESGEVMTPIDEFNFEFGGGLCGEGTSWMPVGSIDIEGAPYASCIDVLYVAPFIAAIFGLDADSLVYPLPSSTRAMLSAVRIGPISVTSVSGETEEEDFIIGFFPGEMVSLYSITFRDYLERGLGYPYSMAVSCAQDHEGYLLTVEDWLAGGYEPAINLWGPLQGEYLLEKMLELIELLRTDVKEDPTDGGYDDLEHYGDKLSPVTPQITEDAGTVPDEVPDYLYSRDGFIPPHPQPESEIPRITGIATFIWIGGDAVIDLPRVFLERETFPGSGIFEEVSGSDGRPIDDSGYEMIITYTPFPLERTDTPGTHYWMVEWQAVTDDPGIDHFAGIEEGRYRFRIEGLSYDGTDDDFPFEGTPYDLHSDPFEVLACDIDLSSFSYDGSRITLHAAYPEAERGFRLLSLSSDPNTPTHLASGDDGEATVMVDLYSSDEIHIGSFTVASEPQGDYSTVMIEAGSLSSGSYEIKVTDEFGNRGEGRFSI